MVYGIQTGGAGGDCILNKGKSRAIVSSIVWAVQVGGGATKGYLIRAQKPRSERIFCEGRLGRGM